MKTHDDKLDEILDVLREQDAFLTMIAHCMKVQMEGGGHYIEAQKLEKLFEDYERRRHTARNGGFHRERDTDPAPPRDSDAE